MGIIFGAMAGLLASFILFAISGDFGTNVGARLVIQVVGFVVSGYVAGRFSLVEASAAGGFAALILFVLIAFAAVLGNVPTNIFGLALLGATAILGGSTGATIAEKTRRV